MPAVHSLTQQIQNKTQPNVLKPAAPLKPLVTTKTPVLAPLTDRTHIQTNTGIPAQLPLGPAPLESLKASIDAIPFANLLTNPNDFQPLLTARSQFTQKVSQTFQGLSPQQKAPLIQSFQNQFDLKAAQTLLKSIDGRLGGVNSLSQTSRLQDFETVKAQHKMASQILNTIRPASFAGLNSESKTWFLAQEKQTHFGASQTKAKVAHQQGDANLALEMNHLRFGRKSLNDLSPLRSFIVWKTPKLNDPVLTRTLLNQLPSGPVSGPAFRALNTAYQGELQSQLKDAKKNLKSLQKSGPAAAVDQAQALVTFQDLMFASELSKTDKYKNKIDTSALKNKLDALQSSPAFEAALDSIRTKALAQNLGTPAQIQVQAQQQVTYLNGAAFQERLYLLSPENQAALIQQELQSLYLLNPDVNTLEKTSDAIMLNAFKFHAEEIYANLPQEKQDEALVSVLEAMENQKKPGFLSSVLGMGRSGTHFLDASSDNLRHLNKLNIKGGAAHKIQEVLQRLQRNPKWAGRLARLDKLNQSGVFSQADSVLAVALLVAGGGLPEGPRGVATALQLMSRAEDYSQLAVKGAKLLNGSDKVVKFLTLGSKTVKAFKMLGPIGDGVSAVLDFKAASSEWEAGDRFGASMKYISSGASVASGVAGATMILAPKSGKWAPAVFLGATAVGLGAWGLDVAFGDTDEETLLKNLNVYK